MEIAQNITSTVGVNFHLILISIMNLLNIAINFAIKILAIYIMYLLIKVLKRYLNDK